MILVRFDPRRLAAPIALVLALAPAAITAQTALPPPGGATAQAQAGTAPATGGATPPPLTAPTATPPPIQAPVQYYVGLGGQPAGPFTQAQVQNMMAAGQITPQTLIWKEGMAGWAPVAQVMPGAGPTPNPPTPTPNPVPQVPDAVKFVSGLWTLQNGSTVIGSSPATVSANGFYKPDGTYTANGLVNIIGGAGQSPDMIQVTSDGTWTAQINGQQLSITINGKAVATSQISGQRNEYDITNDTDIFTIVDARTLRDKDGNLHKKKQ